MTRPSTVVFAYSEVGYRCLETLLDRGVNLSAVITYRDNPEEEIWFRSVAELARSRGIEPWLDLDLSSQETFKAIKELKPKIIFSFYYRDLIPEKILKLAKLGAFNVHGSLLPRYRGRACINWAVLNGETETGATLHRMTAQADRGNIVDQEVVSIGHEDTSKDVFLKVAGAASEITSRSLEAIESGDAKGVPQDDSLATVFGGRKPEDGLIRWDQSSKKIYDLIRAVTHPYPGAFSFFHDKKVFFWWGIPMEGASLGRPGSVLSLDPLVISTGKGNLEVSKIQLEGGPETDGASFAKSHLRLGATFTAEPATTGSADKNKDGGIS